MKNWKTVFVVSGVTLALSAICGVAHLRESSHRGEISPQLDKAEFAQKTKKLQMPFIANKGQVDEQVEFYAKTFGGTVFVTKGGEIVYALPKSGDGENEEVHHKDTKDAEERSEKHISHKDTKDTEEMIEGGTDFVVSAQQDAAPNPCGRLLEPAMSNTIPIPNDRNETHPRPLLLEGRSGV